MDIRVVKYAPRPVFVPFHTRKERWAVLVCHRRAGKTTALLADMLRKALEGPSDGRYGFISPLYSQSKSIGWDILLGLTEQVALKRYESELRVDLLNGARIRLFGSDNVDSLRGLRWDGVALDEYADVKANLFPEVIRPALADRKGWAVFAGTPKGPGHFRDLYDTAQRNDEWYVAYLPVSVTNILTEDELNDARQLMSEEVYRQEFECSWAAPRSGSYYGSILEKIDSQITHVPHDPEQTVEAAFDLGWRDSTAIWFWQDRPDGWAIIDHDEASGRALADWIELLRSKGYRYKHVWLPHDARAKSLQTGKSTIEQLIPHFPCRIAPELSVQQGIDAVRLVLPKCYFNNDTCHVGLRRLRRYGRRWNERSGAFSDAPMHDENSHSADAFRYAALVMRQRHTQPLTLALPPDIPASSLYTLDDLWDTARPHRPAGAHAM